MRTEIAQLIEPVFTYALHVHERMQRGDTSKLDRQSVQAVLKQLLSTSQPQSTLQVYGGDLAENVPAVSAPAHAFLGVRYALTCWLDELFLHDSPWAGDWETRKLETELYGTNDRAWKFWEQAELARARLYGEALEVFARCVALGFRGDLRTQPKALASWLHSLPAHLPALSKAPALDQADSAPPPLPELRGSLSWLWHTTAAEEDAAACTEVDDAWEAACAELRAQGLKPATTPLFLVLGKTAQGAEAFLQAAFPTEQHRILIRRVPADPRAPFCVFATRDAIYVWADRCSLGNSVMLHDATPSRGATKRQAPLPAFATIGGNAAAFAHGSLNGRATLAASLRDQPASPRLAAHRTTDSTRQAGQLQRLCQLLVHTRRPGPPLHGILVLLPYAATEHAETAAQLSHRCRRDLAIITRTTQLRCPAFALLCDWETESGAKVYLNRLAPAQKHHRLGQSYPWRRSSTPAETRKQIQATLRWLSEDFIPGSLNTRWRCEDADGSGADTALRHNRALVRMECQLRKRREHLAMLLSAFDGAEQAPAAAGVWLGGYYLGATGHDADSEQAFVAGVLQKLYDQRGYLQWSAAAIHEDHLYRRWTWLAYGALAMLGMLFVLLAIVMWMELASIQ